LELLFLETTVFFLEAVGVEDFEVFEVTAQPDRLKVRARQTSPPIVINRRKFFLSRNEQY
jgi:hypothetical protein